MTTQAVDVRRDALTDGSVKLVAEDCVFLYRRPRAGVLTVTITGYDRGQFGTSSLDEIRLELLRERPVELFVDAREALGPAVSVSEEWTRFFSLNQPLLRRVHVLVGSKVVELTVAIAQHLSRTGSLIQIYSDASEYEARLAACVTKRD